MATEPLVISLATTASDALPADRKRTFSAASLVFVPPSHALTVNRVTGADANPTTSARLAVRPRRPGGSWPVTVATASCSPAEQPIDLAPRSAAFRHTEARQGRTVTSKCRRSLTADHALAEARPCRSRSAARSNSTPPPVGLSVAVTWAARGPTPSQGAMTAPPPPDRRARRPAAGQRRAVRRAGHRRQPWRSGQPADGRRRGTMALGGLGLVLTARRRRSGRGVSR